MRKDVLLIDAGIVDVVLALNQIKGIRTSSCCDGHGVQRAWVTMNCSPEAGCALIEFVLNNRNADIRISRPWLLELSFLDSPNGNSVE